MLRLINSASRSCRPIRLGSYKRALSSLSSSSHSTVNEDEIAHFSRLSSLWWDEQGEFHLLHKMNPVRMQFVQDKMLEIYRDEHAEDGTSASQVLRGLDVLDVGCGGGLLSESLARSGANTIGIDASESNIAIASLHATSDSSLSFSPSAPSTSPASSSSPKSGKARGSLTYQHTSVEDLLARHGPGTFDVVCSMEVLEHVDNPRNFLNDCAQLVKPGGHLFLSTIARTPLAYLLTIFAAEHALRLVTPGTHTYSKFINADELTQFFCKPLPGDANDTSKRPWISRLYGGLPSRTEAETRGIIYLPWESKWTLVPRGAPGATIWGDACNYMFWVRRPLH